MAGANRPGTGNLDALIKECQKVAREIWLAAEDSKEGTGMKRAQPYLAVPAIREGLYHVPKFTYDFAVITTGRTFALAFRW